MKGEDVGFLVGQLCEHASKWKEIGLALHFHLGELENIRQSFPTANVQELLAKLLDQWSQWPTATHTTPPTMEMLRDALRSGPVGLGAVATDLYDKRHLLPSRYVILHW